MIPYVSVTDIMGKIKSPLLKQLECARQAELAALDAKDRPGLLDLLDAARGERMKPRRKRRVNYHGLRVIEGGKK